MKVTAILKGWTESYWTRFAAYDAPTQFNEVQERARAMPEAASIKVATGQARDAVELQAIRKGPYVITSRIEPRKGYKLVTFEFTKETP